MLHDRGQMLGTEPGLMEMTEVEYLQHLIQAQVEAQAVPDARAPPAAVPVKDATGSTVISPFTRTQAIDLSTSPDEHCLVMQGEKTPAPYGEVPGFVLDRIRSEDSPIESSSHGRTSTVKRSRSAARVCLEKRFKTMSAEAPRPSDIQSAVLSNFLTILQQSAEVHEAVIHPQMQKWMKNDRAHPFEISNPYVGGVFNPVTNMCGQVIGHIPHVVEPKKHQGLIIPRGFSLNVCPERVVPKAHFTRSSNPTDEKKLVITESSNGEVTPAAARNPCSVCSSQPIKAASDSAGESGGSTRKRARSSMSLSQRRERHNTKERERRKRIRSCCDELNLLVPFCHSDTDKVTTLQWTTTFLRYINKTYGDTFKEEFQMTFTTEEGLFLQSGPSGHGPVHRGMDEALSLPHLVEQ